MENDKLSAEKVSRVDQLAKAPLTRASFDMMQVFASNYIKAGLSQKGETEGTLILKIQTGREVGLPPMAAMRHLYVVNNRVTMEGAAMLSLIKRDLRCELAEAGWDDENKRGWFHTIRSQPQSDEVFYFSMTDAEQAGLANKGTWQQYPQIMCPWRAVAMGGRFVWADVLLGLHTPEELGADVEIVHGAPRVITSEVADAEAAQPTEPEPEPTDEVSAELSELQARVQEAGEKAGCSPVKIAEDIKHDMECEDPAYALSCRFDDYSERVNSEQEEPKKLDMGGELDGRP